MNRLIGIVAGAVLVGGIAGAGIAGAVTGNDNSTSPSSAAAEAAAPAPTHSRLTPEAIYERAAPGVVVISATQTETSSTVTARRCLVSMRCRQSSNSAAGTNRRSRAGYAWPPSRRRGNRRLTPPLNPGRIPSAGITKGGDH